MPFATINSHELHYTDIAPSSSSGGREVSTVTLLFVHGLGSTQNYYFPIFPYLTSFRCVIFDNYGAGRSKYVPGTETSVSAMAKDVTGLMDHLKVEKAVVIGYSMGGMVPSYLAATCPERVAAGICIGPVHPNETVANVFKQRIPVVQKGKSLHVLLVMPVIITLNHHTQQTPSRREETFVKDVQDRYSPVSEKDGMEAMANTIPNTATGPNATATQKGFIREMLMAQDPEGYCANCKAIELATPPNYAAVKCPMLIVAGEVDKSAPLAWCQTIFERLGTDNKGKRLEVLKGVGHWHCVEAPDEVGPLVRGFVEELP